MTNCKVPNINRLFNPQSQERVLIYMVTMVSNTIKKEYYQAFMNKNTAPEINVQLTSSWLETPLGPMLAIADEKTLYLLEFVERRKLDREIERLRMQMKATITPDLQSPFALLKVNSTLTLTELYKNLKHHAIFLALIFKNLYGRH